MGIRNIGTMRNVNLDKSDQVYEEGNKKISSIKQIRKIGEIEKITDKEDMEDFHLEQHEDERKDYEEYEKEKKNKEDKGIDENRENSIYLSSNLLNMEKKPKDQTFVVTKQQHSFQKYNKPKPDKNSIIIHSKKKNVY